MSATITPTRVGLYARMRGALQAAYIRRLIQSAKFDVLLAQKRERLAPGEIALANSRVAELGVHLVDAENGVLRRWPL